MPQPRRRHLGGLVLVAALVGLRSRPLAAGPDVWISKGPYGGQIWTLAIDPTSPATIYAGTDLSGVFKSTNAGSSWVAASEGIQAPGEPPPGYDGALRIMELAMVPGSPEELYAATSSPGLFKTVDGAKTWSYLGEEIFAGGFSIAVAPSAPSTVYFGTTIGVFKSTDAGVTWVGVNNGLPGGTVGGLVIDPGDARKVYALVAPSGIYKTTNGGVSWQEASSGLPAVFGNGTLVMHPFDPRTLYLAIDAGTGVYRTEDGAGSWEALPGPGPALSSVAIDPLAPSTLYVGSYLEGLYKSVDEGESWVRLDSTGNGFFDEDVMTIAVDPVDPSRVYVGVRGAGVFRSLDGGDHWELATEGLAAFQTSAVVVDPETSSVLYAGGGVGGFGSAGVWKSVDGGESWEPALQGLTNFQVFDLEGDPENPATLYAATSGGVHKTTNGAASWVPINNGLTDFHVESLAIDPLTPQTVYAGTAGSLFKTTNGGQIWAHADSGLGGDFVFDIAIDPQLTTTLYAAEPDGLYKSTNGGASWDRLDNLQNPFVETVAVDPNVPLTVYADGSVAKSVDGGFNWEEGPPFGTVRLIEVDPTDSATLYAVVFGEGLYRSADGGETWALFHEGLANVAVQAIAFDPQQSRRVYAGTLGGVYEMLLGGIFEDGFESGDTSAWDQVTQ